MQGNRGKEGKGREGKGREGDNGSQITAAHFLFEHKRERRREEAGGRLHGRKELVESGAEIKTLKSDRAARPPLK